MKIVKKLVGSVMILMVVMVTFCSFSYASEIKYTDNLIPVMTSDTAPSGVASASSCWSGYPAYFAFNHTTNSLGDAWGSNQGDSNPWLEYDFAEAKCITKYTITSRNPIFVSLASEVPTNWTFEGFDEQLNKWVVLDKRENVTDWEVGVKKEFTFLNSTYYQKYKINIVGNVVIGELEMMESIDKATPTATNQLKLVLEVNEDKQLSISDELTDNTDKTWTTSDSTIATVDENGKIKALKPGNTVITCTGDDYTESINVLVVDLEYQLAIDLNVGDKCRLTVDDLTNTTNVTWSSYDSTIATVSAKGKVTAVSEGLTYIVASDKEGNEIGRIYIRVRN